MSYWIKVGPNPMTSDLIRTEKCGHRDKIRGEDHVQMEAEDGMTYLQAPLC